ncbi:MAG: DISARM system helicase DrmA [Polyangiaceae bacterium]|nr:DISARM system helicase DrmA [Polyangiaceae bacterium]
MRERNVRDRLVEALKADLVGPFVPDDQAEGGQEILPVAPSRWYLTGFLAPQGGRTPEPDDEESLSGEAVAGSDSQAEDAGSVEPEPKRPVRFPASLGLSVFLPPGSGDELVVEVRYAEYDKVEVALEKRDAKRPGWKRVPHGPVKVPVPLDPAALAKGVDVPLSRGLTLRGELRTTSMDGLPDGTRVLSLFLVNERAVLEKDRDLAFVFQVELALYFEPGFVARPNHRGEEGEADAQVFALQFRKHLEWAVGHNTSVAPPEVVDGSVRVLRTTPLPAYEVPQIEHRRFEDATTSMKALGTLPAQGLENALLPLPLAYAKWIEQQRRVEVDRLEKTRDQLCQEADRARARIREGIRLLTSDPLVFRAFQLANQAMHVAAMKADEVRVDKRYVDGKVPEWRPFQLAFVLMNLPSIADPNHDDRKLAELIYFPTGGGKTEAYLGLIAFTLLLRRLRGHDKPHEGRGVAVILRYTLRLLTLDQLGRAATLICALEQLRRKFPQELGDSRFTIGLWVGKSASANTLKEVHQALHDFSSNRGETPFPLANCPWCGEPVKIEAIKLLDADGKVTKKNFARAVVYCSRADCAFTEKKLEGEGLPVLFVDEQIYEEVPSFVVATVDKFAMVPWRGEAGMLFGRATHLAPRRAYGVMDDVPKSARRLPQGLLPPELIVQDELHLISGPLGTMVGLYEAAVDYLCERPIEGAPRPPKVVCSTATVRRAKEQIRALFGREMVLFPPRGVDDDDNFFAHLADLNEKPGRLYVGVGAPGRALRAVSVRSYATLLAAAQCHFQPKGKPEQPADPYLTLVGYFNSLRELGGMRRLVEDEVTNRVRAVDADDGRRPLLYVGPHPWAANRKLELPAELTSRETTENVKRTKERLGTCHTDRSRDPLDVVLASNMISVGLDINRLGLMVVTGQPKTASEYIQATSRVGRAYPGLVVTCLNTARPRDRSHYERFVSFHQSFYRDVEATSVTPFSGQSLERGLVGTLLTMLRHGLTTEDGQTVMEPPTGVMKLHPNRSAAERVLEQLVTRARGHRDWYDDEAETRIAELVRKRGRNFLDAWERVVEAAREAGTDRTYSKNDRAASQGKPLLFTATDPRPEDRDERQFQIATSMRDVEPSVLVWLRFKQLDERS